MKKNITLSCLAILLFFWSCHKDTILQKDGYILFNDLKFFQFLPVKQMNLETSISSLYSENLERGFQFEPSKRIFESIYIVADTFQMQGLTTDLAKDLYVLKIVPVRLEYKFIPKEKQIQFPIGIRSHTIQIKGKKITMIYDNNQYEILKITPLLVKKKNMAGSLIKPFAGSN